MSPVGRRRKFSASCTRTVSRKDKIKTRGKPILDQSSVNKEECAVKSLTNCAKGSNVEDEKRKNVAANITSHLKCQTRAMRMDNDGRDVVESRVGDVTSKLKKAKNKISKYSVDKKKSIRFNESTRYNSSTNNDEAVGSKDSSTMKTLSDTNSLPCDTSCKRYTDIAYSDSTSTQTRSAKRKEKCRNPKHFTVAKSSNQKYSRLTSIVTKETEKYHSKTLECKSIRKSLNINKLDDSLVTVPASPEDKSTSSIINSRNTDQPYRPNSIHMEYPCDFNHNELEVSDAQTSQKTKTNECNNSCEIDENCVQKGAKKRDIPINQTSVNINKCNEKTKVIMNKKFVCQCNRSVINKFCGNSFPTSEFCCHVYIKKGECDSVGGSNNRKNLFPDNIHSSASNLKEYISEDLRNESKQVDVFDRKQNEEMKFVPETEEELTRNSTEVIVKNSAYNFRRNYPFKQGSLKCEDAYVTPKKNTIRRKTIYFSSLLKDTEISKNNTPAVSCIDVIAETSPSTAVTNISKRLEQLKQFEMPNINTSQAIINNLNGTSESSASASGAAETTQLITKEIAMRDESNHPEDIKQVETLENTSQNGDVSGFEIISNFVSEANSDQDQKIIVSGDENEFLKMTTSLSYTCPENNLEKYCAGFSPENENLPLTLQLIEKEVTEMDTVKSHQESEFCINLKDFKEGDEDYFVKEGTNNSIHALTQMESESPNENRELGGNKKISSPCSYNVAKRKKLSMPELEVTEHRQIKKKALRDIKEFTSKFAISAKREDECYEKVMSICDHPSIEPSFAVSSEVPEYLVRAVFQFSDDQYSEEAHANLETAAPPPSQPVLNPSDQNRSQNPNNFNFYPVELGRIYYQFYDEVVYILKGYIPLQKAYSDTSKIIHETFRRFPHSFNNFNYESLSLDMITHNRRKLYSKYLLVAILKLPTDLPQFHFAHFLRLTTELLNRSGISISISVVVQHLLAVMLACNMDYKQNKTSDKFKKNLESFLDTFNNNGTNRPEFGMTFTQRYLLKTQVLTYLQLYLNQKILSERSNLMPYYYSRQQHYIRNAYSNNIQQTFGTCRNENSPNEIQPSVIQNSIQSNRSFEPIQYPNLRNILNNKTSDPSTRHIVPNTGNITSSSNQKPTSTYQWTSHGNSSAVMKVTNPMKHPEQVNSIISVTDKIKASNKSPVNKMTNNQVLPNLPMISSCVPQSKINAHSSFPLMTNSTVQSSPLQTSPSAKTLKGNSITNVSPGDLCSINNKVNDEKTDASDTTIPAIKEILVPNDCIPHIISNEYLLEDNSISKELPVCPSRANQPQSIEMTTSSTSEGLELKTQSSGNHNSVDSNADTPCDVEKERTTLNDCNVDVINGKSSKEAKKCESSDVCVESMGSISSDVNIKEGIVAKFPFCGDEIIDLTWIEDFTEEELRKEDDCHDFLCIENEPSVTCTEVRDLNDYGPKWYSDSVEEEDFPEFFSYDY